MQLETEHSNSTFTHHEAKSMRRVLKYILEDLGYWKQAHSTKDRWLAEVRQHVLFQNEDEYCKTALPPLTCIPIQQLLWQRRLDKSYPCGFE